MTVDLTRLKMLAREGDKEAIEHLVREGLRRGEASRWLIQRPHDGVKRMSDGDRVEIRCNENGEMVRRVEVPKDKIIQHIDDASGVVLEIPAQDVECVYPWTAAKRCLWLLDCFEVKVIDGGDIRVSDKDRWYNGKMSIEDIVYSLADHKLAIRDPMPRFSRMLKIARKTLVELGERDASMLIAGVRHIYYEALAVLDDGFKDGPHHFRNHANQLLRRTVYDYLSDSSHVSEILGELSDVFRNVTHDISIPPDKQTKHKQMAMTAFEALMFDRLLGVST